MQQHGQARAADAGGDVDRPLDGLYAQLYRQQFQGGLVEARCEDGVVLASGDVLATATG